MKDRTRILGPELVDALARVDELLEAHDSNKGHKWLEQTWQEHLLRAIVHFSVAIRNAEDGTEIEASHGATRALMGLQKILHDPEIERKLCKMHAGPPALMIFSSAYIPQFQAWSNIACVEHFKINCELCNYVPRGNG